MSLTERAFLGSPTAPASIEALRRQYACAAVDLTGSPHALYDRHLFFDNVMHPAAAGLRERYEAVARSLRDALSQRWIHTEQSYERNNPKRMPPPPARAPSWGSCASRRRRLGSRSMQAVVGVRRRLKGGVLAMAKADLDSLKERLPLIEIEYLRHAATELGLDDLEGCALEKLANLHELTALYATLHGAHRGRVTELERPWWRRLFCRRWVGLAAAWCAGRSCDRFLLRRLKHRRRPIQRLSMEFLIGRSLANNIVNLSLAPFFDRFLQQETINTRRLLVGRCCRLLRFPGVQPWRLRLRASGDAGRRVSTGRSRPLGAWPRSQVPDPEQGTCRVTPQHRVR